MATVTVIKARPEERDRNDDGSGAWLSSGKLSYRVNCLGKLIIQVKMERFVTGKGWKFEWVDAKAHHITLADE